MQVLFPESAYLFRTQSCPNNSWYMTLLPAILQGDDDTAFKAETADAHTSIVSNITIRLGHKTRLILDI